MKRSIVWIAALSLACGGDSSGPSAASVTGIAGNNQSALRGTALPVPLSFTALGSDGLPVAGVPVSWSASPSGSATFTPASGPTDPNGVASTNVVLGSTLGPITMRATVPGVATPVTYTATVLDPCAILPVYTVGQTVDGALTTNDCLQGQWYYDFFALDLPAGQQSIRLKMHGSGTFDDTYLELYRATGPIVAFDDDSVYGVEGARNSQLDIILPGDTAYIIGANSFEEFATGSYTLESENRAVALNGCREVWVVRGVAISDSLTTSDCADSAATPRRYDVARIIAFGGTVLTIQQKSSVINPSLALYQVAFGQTVVRTLVDANDDSLAGTNDDAFIRYSVSTSNVYDVIVSSSTGGETGAYTFEVSASTTLSPYVTGSTPRAGKRNQGGWWRDIAIPKRSTP